ncbi:MAG: hypothetical protein HY319_07095 [Armatimonadetes bacterium]|nr:hypothetical protein [Armatimonadota bacterium]
MTEQRGFHGSTLPCCECSGTLEYQGDVEKTVKTRVGDITLKRAYYHGCGKGLLEVEERPYTWAWR